MFENVDRRTDGRRTDDGVTGILIAHLGAFGSGELKINIAMDHASKYEFTFSSKSIEEKISF